MTSHSILSPKAIALMVAGFTVLVAGTQAEPGGRFDMLTKVRGKRIVADPTPVPSPDPTPVVTTAPTAPTTSSNALYPELTAVPSNFDINTLLAPTCNYTGGTIGCLPGTMGADPVGAFRFMCEPGQILRDDPIVYPGQPGKSHLHQFFGNTSANANSTYSSLRTTGGSSCEGFGATALNRSAYWMPAMLDGKGNVVKSNIISIYYKRRPASDPYCSLTSGEPHAQGNCVPLPNGLRFIFGYDMLTANAPTGSRYFTCKGQTATASESYQTMAAAEEHCPTAQNPDGTYNQLGLFLQAPDCWDGKNLDSANHRDHVAYISYGYWGFPKCPATHPYVIPAFTMGVWYTVDANLPTWHLSSDEMLPGTAPGTTLHADWFGAWDNTVEAMWMDKCINNHLNCSGGDLGSGRGVNGMWGINWVTNPRLVPVP